MRLVDTNVAIDYLRERPEAVSVLEQTVATGEVLAASEIVRFELLAGIRPGEEHAVEQFCARLLWVPVDEAISRLAASLARRFAGSHVGVEDGDYLVAATALDLDAKLLTRNVRHFPMFPGLTAPY